MYLNILIPPTPRDSTKYVLSEHCCKYFCFFIFGVYIDIEKKTISKPCLEK